MTQMKSFVPEQHPRFLRTVGVGLLAVSILALLLAPLQMPASYTWLEHTTSESAAQGIPGAWLARLGFMILGLTVIWLAVQQQARWSLPVRLLHLLFGVCMVGAAVFSSRPWLPDLPFDPIEDALHSFAATAMGFAFAGGVTWHFFQRGEGIQGRIIDLVAVVASIAIPLSMVAFPTWAGLLQRGMFAIAYVWYGGEVLNMNPEVS
jgi:hypothetical protein